jgi:WD40 repeat protein
VYDVTFSTDGARIATAGTDSTLGLWDIHLLEKEHLLEGPSTIIEDLAISSDGRWAVSAGTDGIVRRWNLSNGESHVLHQLSGEGRQFHCVDISPNDRWIAAGEGDFSAHEHEASFFIWDARTLKLKFNRQDHNAIVWDVAFSRDSRQLATAGGEMENGPGGINIWDVATGRRLMTLPPRDEGIDGHLHPGVKSVDFSADGSKVYGICRASPTDLTELLIRWDIAAQPPKREIWKTPTPRVMSVDVSPDGRSVGVTSWGTVLIYDAENGELRLWDATPRNEMK